MSFGVSFPGPRRRASAPAFDPATLPLSLWLREYNGGQWHGTASAGDSASKNMNIGSSEPGVLTLANGKRAATFSGYLQSFGGLGNYQVMTGAAGSLAALVKVISSPQGSTDAWSSPYILGDGSGATAGIAIGEANKTTAQFFWDDFNSPKRQVRIAAPIGAWALYQMRWNGTIVEGRINGGTWQSVAWRTPDFYGAFYIGKSAGSNYLAMQGQEFFGSFVRLSDADFDGLLTYARSVAETALV